MKLVRRGAGRGEGAADSMLVLTILYQLTWVVPWLGVMHFACSVWLRRRGQWVDEVVTVDVTILDLAVSIRRIAWAQSW